MTLWIFEQVQIFVQKTSDEPWAAENISAVSITRNGSPTLSFQQWERSVECAISYFNKKDLFCWQQHKSVILYV